MSKRGRQRWASALIGLTLVATACAGGDTSDTALLTSAGPEASTTTAGLNALTYGAEDGASLPIYGGNALPNDQTYDSTFFDNYGVNPRIDTEDDAFSTFAVDVDTGAYTVGRRFLEDEFLPDKDSVRVEEYVNYFDQGYDSPDEGAFAIHIDGGPTPFVENDRYQMIRIGLQSLTPADESRPPANLTFVIDVSGSMAREDRLGLVKESLGLLVDSLNPDDQVAIVVYGSNADVILEPTAVEERRDIERAIERLEPTGSTNAAEGLELGYQMARRAYSPNAINRVILASDGVANVDVTSSDGILALIGDEARKGVQLLTVGFGMGNYNDVLMEQLANDGDGFYAYVDTLREAERLFVHDLTGTLLTVAKDAKVQVEFNPAAVERWRLVGFENRDVADEDFRNDDIDAGEIGAGHSVTALYEIKLEEDADPAQGLATVFLRWEDPDTRGVEEISRELFVGELADSYDEMSVHFQLATTVATYAEVLRESYWAGSVDLDLVAAEADRLAGTSLGSDEKVAEFAELAETAADLKR